VIRNTIKDKLLQKLITPKDTRGVRILKSIPHFKFLRRSLVVVAAVYFPAISIITWGLDSIHRYSALAPIYMIGMAATMVFACALDVVIVSRLRSRILRLTSADGLARQFGIDSTKLEQVATEQGVKPQYNINGIDYYDLSDFGYAALLLRPSASSDSTRLLQPVLSASTEGGQLLRAANVPHQGEGE
jgi:hypothetical protein